MNENLKVLRDVGAQTIHSETHIPREFIQAIIHETFDGLQSVQFMGFISILEREYDVDLSELKEKAKIHFKEEVEKKHKVFVSVERKSTNTKLYVFLVLVLFLSTIYMTTESEQNDLFSEHIEKVDLVEENVIGVAESNENNLTLQIIKEEIVEVNLTVEEPPAEVIVEPEIVITRTLKILPKRKIWAGYINIKTNQKYQQVFRKDFTIDPSKDWLFLFGSGTARLEVNGEEVKFSSKQNMRFKYVDGVFSKITITEFKSLNKGRKW